MESEGLSTLFFQLHMHATAWRGIKFSRGRRLVDDAARIFTKSSPWFFFRSLRLLLPPGAFLFVKERQTYTYLREHLKVLSAARAAFKEGRTVNIISLARSLGRNRRVPCFHSGNRPLSFATAWNISGSISAETTMGRRALIFSGIWNTQALAYADKFSISEIRWLT